MAKTETPKIPEVDFAKIAQRIREVGKIGKDLQSAGLTRRAIVLLLEDLTNVRKGDIDAILRALPELPKHFLTKDAP